VRPDTREQRKKTNEIPRLPRSQVYHQLKAKRLARFLAKPVAFTFLGMVLTALAANHLITEQQASLILKSSRP
jgi:hypothetical protein